MKACPPFAIRLFAAMLAPILFAGAEPEAPEKAVEVVASDVLRKAGKFQPVEGGIARVNGGNYYNRPLYCNGIPAMPNLKSCRTPPSRCISIGTRLHQSSIFKTCRSCSMPKAVSEPPAEFPSHGRVPTKMQRSFHSGTTGPTE
jgi:hypothetical protein